MNKILFSILFAAAVSLQASDIVIEKSTLRSFGKQLHVNAKIVQLSNQRQQIVSRLGGHLEKYYVEPGKKVKKGDKIAQIQSLELSRMSAEFIALGKKLEAARARLESTESLYKKGLASGHDLNREQIALASIEAERNAVASQLASLDIDTASLKKPTDTLVIRAHADGLVSRLLVPLHTNLSAQTPIISLVQSSGYYAIAYIGVAEALKMPKKVEGRLKIDGIGFKCRYLYLLPKVDEETQRAQMLFWIESEQQPLLLNAFAEMEINLPPFETYVAVKRTALTMFEGEWVVFTPAHEEEEHGAHEEHEEHGEHEGHEEHGEHEEHGQHEEHGDHEEHEGHGEHGEHAEESPYQIKVVEPITGFGGYVAVKGIEPQEAYVADGVYFVKSLLLKSRLGGHGH
ncbi:efflux RND transporter periplasmic adaptor subunit [Hydrogenimonas sp.]